MNEIDILPFSIYVEKTTRLANRKVSIFLVFNDGDIALMTPIYFLFLFVFELKLLEIVFPGVCL